MVHVIIVCIVQEVYSKIKVNVLVYLNWYGKLHCTNY